MRPATDLILRLPRPQYVSVPEALIVALAHREYTVDEPKEVDGLALAKVFRTIPRRTKTLAFVRSEPHGDELTRFGRALREEGLISTSADDLVATAILNSIAGVKSERGVLQPSSPLTPAIALMQNMRGLQGTRNPPDLAEILESLDRLGALRGPSNDGVAHSWRRASMRRLEIDPLLAGVDKALGSLMNIRATNETYTEELSLGARTFDASPFSWFAENWRRLTSPEWVDALPARVWVDWATTVLRLAVGMGYLWEAAWYEAVARVIAGDDEPTWDAIRERMPVTVPWKSSRAGESALDVAPLLMWRIRHGGQIRGLLTEWLTTHSAEGSDCDSELLAMSIDRPFVDHLTDALGNRRQTSENQWEAVKYALKTRDEGGPFADYYGLLQASGRYLRVKPGTEWMAVVGSLACSSPGEETNLGQVLRSLSDLGLRPEIRDIVTLLERAGMARGSADADQGVIVRSAF